MTSPGTDYNYEYVSTTELDVKLMSNGDFKINYGTAITEGSAAFADEITNLRINLAKTNFRLAAIQGATRYAMKNMIVDDFQDTSGIDNVNSQYYYNATNKNIACKNAGNAIPIMTGFTTPSGNVLYSSNYGSNWDPWHAFDGVKKWRRGRCRFDKRAIKRICRI